MFEKRSLESTTPPTSNQLHLDCTLPHNVTSILLLDIYHVLQLASKAFSQSCRLTCPKPQTLNPNPKLEPPNPEPVNPRPRPAAGRVGACTSTSSSWV